METRLQAVAGFVNLPLTKKYTTRLHHRIARYRMKPDPSDKPDPIKGYGHPERFEAKGFEHWVYKSETKNPPVIIMHELFGLTTECVALADRIVAAGFRVYMPLFFGKPKKKRLFSGIRYCVSKEMYAFAGNCTSPIVDWLRALVGHVAKAEGTQRVGVIGMCLTGNFALTLIAETTVNAVVCCQPSLPFMRETGLAMARRDLDEAIAAAHKMDKPAIIGFRYEKDCICPAARFKRIRREFGDAFDGEDLPGGGHSTLTGKKPHEGALADTIQYLKKRLLHEPAD